jgi:RHS repeat-associated protein
VSGGRNARGWVGFGGLVLIACSSHATSDRGRTGSLARALAAAAYTYDALGLRSGAAPSNADLLGRATSFGGATLGWGPDGELAAVTDAAGVRTEMITDETGQRLAWRRDGSVLEAEIDGVHLSSGHVQETTKVGTHVVGILDNGAFSPVPLDLRGSVIAEPWRAGSSAEATPGPYGERSAEPACASVLDYAAKGADPALGTIVMGVRDYDPASGAFLSPDPKYLEHPSSCVESPVECNLYGYAHAQPADFVDPTGKDATSSSDDATKPQGGDSSSSSSHRFDPGDVGGKCWDKQPSPRDVARENYDWYNTAEGRGYSKAYEAAALAALEKASSDAFRTKMQNEEQSWIGTCPGCYDSNGKLRPEMKMGPGDHVREDLGLLEGAGPISSLLLTETFVLSVVGGWRQPDMKLLLQELKITKIMDDYCNHMGVSTYGELQNYTINDLRLHMELTRNKQY